MRGFITLFFSFFIFFDGLSQPGESGWYKHLVGKIGTHPITMHLHKEGNEYAGYYYYHSKHQPISLRGEDTSIQGKISLYTYTDWNEGEQFVFDIKNNIAEGTWQMNHDKKVFAFSAIPNNTLLAFTHVFLKGERALIPDSSFTPYGTIDLASVWPVNASPADKAIGMEIRKLFGVASGEEDISMIFTKQKNDYLDQYVADYKNESLEDIRQYGFAYAISTHSKVMIAYHSPKWLNLASYHYSYYGGAHGMYGTSYKVISLETNKKLELSDLLNQEGIDILGELLEKYFRIQNKLKPTDPLQEGGLFENNLAPNNNFYLTAMGIGFAYMPYEIASYARGEVEVFIPLKEIMPYLRPSAKNLLQ